MDQAKPENQILCRYQQERCIDSNLDCYVCLSSIELYQVPVKVKEKLAADSATQFIRETRLNGFITR
jgi:hypothetical protein